MDEKNVEHTEDNTRDTQKSNNTDSLNNINTEQEKNNNHTEDLKQQLEESIKLAEFAKKEFLKKKKFSFAKVFMIALFAIILGSSIGIGYHFGEQYILNKDLSTQEEIDKKMNASTEPKQESDQNRKKVEIKVAEKKDTKTNNVLQEDSTLLAIQEIAKTYEPAIVSVVQSNPYSSEEPFGVIGTGIVFSVDDDYVYIVSNQHVMYDTSRGRAMDRQSPLFIAFDDNNICKMEILGSDSLSDIAVVKVKKRISARIF